MNHAADCSIRCVVRTLAAQVGQDQGRLAKVPFLKFLQALFLPMFGLWPAGVVGRRQLEEGLLDLEYSRRGPGTTFGPHSTPHDSATNREVAADLGISVNTSGGQPVGSDAQRAVPPAGRSADVPDARLPQPRSAHWPKLRTGIGSWVHPRRTGFACSRVRTDRT
jgi:hypothetical protein